MVLEAGSTGAVRGTRVLCTASTFNHMRSFHIPYLNKMLQEGRSVTVAASGEPYGMPEGVTCVVVPFAKSFMPWRNARAMRDIMRLFKQGSFDLVLTHTELASFYVRLAVGLAGKGGARVVNTVHGYLFDDATSAPRRCAMLAAERLVARWTDLVLTMNAQDDELAAHHRFCREQPRSIKGFGVDLSSCAPATAQQRLAAREELGLPADATVLLYAAEFSGRKNQAMLIRALTHLPKGVVLALPGSGDLLQECRDLARELAVSERVVFPGQVGNLKTWRAASDVCVSASRYEGMPFHIIEAMACGLPTVASRVKGNEDLVDEGKTGYLYPYGDAARCADCLARLIADADLRAAMGTAAQEKAKDYDLQKVLPTVMELYR